jgi:hypothetical protein
MQFVLASALGLTAVSAVLYRMVTVAGGHWRSPSSCRSQPGVRCSPDMQFRGARYLHVLVHRTSPAVDTRMASLLPSAP